MKLVALETEGKPKWALSCSEQEIISGRVLCRFCNKVLKIGDLGYYCPKDEGIACEECKSKDNRYNHARNFKESFTIGNEHFFVIIKKE